MLDHDGAELVGLAEAKKEAVRRGREIGAPDNRTEKRSIIVADENWRPLWEVPF